ncbi:MAG TPA: GTP-binding protein [Euryarchaeota archaeon]|nr:MAG: GTP-binding protein [Thermoplasmatales archaeon ex4484_6]RLF66273.1 MAG: GTP-binding protein [Thermoplasmata archaeon]HHD16346.1 GTP-binding protein [Euryarchaeota archaeon]
MGLFDSLLKGLLGLFRKKQASIGIYGPPNAGKTTLANRISRDWTGKPMGKTSEIPHETRKAKERKEVVIKAAGSRISFDIVDTPGIATKIDFHNFVEDYGMDEDKAKQRAKEATEGVIEAIKWLDKVDGVLLVMDAAEDPFNQVNVTLLGNLEARKLPTIIVANKMDLDEASPATIRDAFPQHPTIPVSALAGYGMDNLYKAMMKYFR